MVCASSAFVSCLLMIGAELGALVASQSKRIRRSMSANIFIKLRMLYFRRSMTDMTIIKHDVFLTCHHSQRQIGHGHEPLSSSCAHALVLKICCISLHSVRHPGRKHF